MLTHLTTLFTGENTRHTQITLSTILIFTNSFSLLIRELLSQFTDMSGDLKSVVGYKNHLHTFNIDELELKLAVYIITTLT